MGKNSILGVTYVITKRVLLLAKSVKHQAKFYFASCPTIGQTLADRPLEDGLAELQVGASLGTSRDGLALPPSIARLDLEELLDLQHEGEGAKCKKNKRSGC